MKERRLEKKPDCSSKAVPYPVEAICPHCRVDIEIWSDETEITCKLCGSLVHNSDNHVH